MLIEPVIIGFLIIDVKVDSLEILIIRMVNIHGNVAEFENDLKLAIVRNVKIDLLSREITV